MRSHLVRRQGDWIIAGICTAVLMGAGYGLIRYVGQPRSSINDNGDVKTPTYYAKDLYSEGIYKTEPPDSKYPPPATNQANYYRSYTVGDIQMSIEKGNINIDRNPSFGPNTVHVKLYNSENREVEPDKNTLKSVSVGCIAMDKPYRTVQVTVKPMKFKPYEWRDSTLEVDLNCLYIGTADGKYFWKVY